MSETKHGRLHAIAGGGLAPWSAQAEKDVRTTFEDVLRDHEQILIVGIRRDPERTAETQVLYGYQWRSGRTSMNEFLGSLHKLIDSLERESQGDDAGE